MQKNVFNLPLDFPALLLKALVDGLGYRALHLYSISTDFFFSSLNKIDRLAVEVQLEKSLP